ncbi:tRNA(Ile)-lysidine synthase [Granulicella rosea]|uniref:tRNA(Ile)-lysidine synthase n=1 Tax=Granulicella rosea TaxID=474952 RepID=A0A239IIA4_9BACT|nr:tRNA lysidine(34) synthetase TilS [Granulicella rosea]SNS93357.1 tRNA(Ile)-lysidine synthase [Granulicella rosea]
MLTLPRHHFTPGDRLCVAISGGADSVALLLLLHEANTAARNALGVGLSAVHIHHGLRAEESDGDQQFVVELCQRLEIPLHLHGVDTLAHASANRLGIEEAARNLRYAAFHTLLNEGKEDTILTAHTLDDQAETVLMKLLRGAWTEGLSAIHPALALPRGKILRPLLGLRRDDLRTYLKSKEQPWREDSSNADEAFTRNRIRHTVLPLLREENPGLDQTLANMAEIARDEEARWQVELARLLPQVVLPGKPVRGGGRSNSTAPGEAAVAIELERLRAMDPALRRRVIRAAARQIGARISFEETGRILALGGFQADPTVPSKPGAILKLANGVVAERSAREIRMARG